MKMPRRYQELGGEKAPGGHGMARGVTVFEKLAVMMEDSASCSGSSPVIRLSIMFSMARGAKRDHANESFSARRKQFKITK
jgi:hypothetical protein